MDGIYWVSYLEQFMLQHFANMFVAKNKQEFKKVQVPRISYL